MKISTQTYAPDLKLGFMKGMKAIKDAGFDSIDLSLFRMDRDDNVFVLSSWKGEAEKRRDYIDSISLECTQAHAPHIFEFGDEYVLNNIALPRILRAMEIAKILGARLIVIHPLHHLDYYSYKDKIRSLNHDYMLKLAENAEKVGINVGFENMWQHDKRRGGITYSVGGLVDDLIEDVDKIGSERIKVCLDVGHSALVGEEPEIAIRKLGADRLKALHIHDNDYRGDDHTLPFLGKIHWEEVMKSLTDIGYDGEFTYEADSFLLPLPPSVYPFALKLMAEVAKYLVSIKEK